MLYESNESGDMALNRRKETKDFEGGPIPTVSTSHLLESDVHDIGWTSH